MKVEAVTEVGPLPPVVIDARDRRAFEVIGRQQINVPKETPISDISRVAPESYVTWLAWHALHREGFYDEPFAEFEGRCLEVRNLESAEADIPDPTKLAR